MAQEKQSVIRPTDEDARRLARTLVRGARFGAIATLAPETGYPLASRVLIGTDVDGVPAMLVSRLAAHTQAVLGDPRCSLLVGEPGKGDPLAWPRLTLAAEAERVEPDTESHSHLRDRFLRRHPKSQLYVDFPDFSFFRLVPKWASLNGGFGKAYNIFATDLIIDARHVEAISNQELQIIREINALAKGASDLLVKRYFNEKTENWTIVSLDACGLELARREKLLRIELDAPVGEVNGLIALYAKILMDQR
jgi:putative heme iron utilization protein